MSAIFVAGGGGLGREIRSYLLQSGCGFAGFLDDVPGPEVVAKVGRIDPVDGKVIVAVGSIEARLRVVSRLAGSAFLTFVHPSAIVSEDARVGVGSLVGPFCVLGPGTSVGEHSLLNIRTTLGHDTSVGSWCVVSPHTVLAGGSSIGDRTFVGSSVVVFQNIEVGSDCVVSAGAAVNKAASPGSFVAGNPARSMPRSKDDGPSRGPHRAN